MIWAPKWVSGMGILVLRGTKWVDAAAHPQPLTYTDQR